MNTSHKTFMAAGLSAPLSSTAFSQSSGIAWKNGNVLTAQQMQQLDNAKMNVDSLGKPGFAPKLNAKGQITNPVVGSVANAPANDAGDTVSSIADIAKSAQITAHEAVQAWENSTFVKNNAGTSGGIVALDLDSDGSGRVAFEKVDGSWGALQLAGDYATNSDLNTETTNRTNADTDLQNQINNRVLKTGDTMTGALSITGPDSGVLINSSANTNSGYNDALVNYSLPNRYGYAALIGLREHVGQTLGIVLSTYNGSSWYEFDLIAQGKNQGRMVSPAGVSALTSDLPLDAGQKIFTFSATVTGTQDISLPQAMSNVLFVTAQGGTDGKGKCTTTVNGWTNSTVNVSVDSYYDAEMHTATITQTFLVIAIP